MQDETTDDAFRDTGDDESGYVPSVNEMLDNRCTARYVPAGVTCRQCGRGGADFSWLQSIPEGDVDGRRPGRELYFCGVVCIGRYVAEHEPGYDPDIEGTRVHFDRG